ncbi:amidohydrolase [Armatimonadota bacterium]|nr:amidohydrolase [Armatimonadota bacterium]
MNPNTSRRDFLKQSATAGAGLLAGSLVELEAEGVPNAKNHAIPIVDTHQHLWDFRKFRPPWLSSEPKLNKSTTMEDYYKATAGLNVVKTVYMEVDVAQKQQMEEAQWVTEVCKAHNTPMVAGVVSCRPALPSFGDYARHFKGSPYIKGTRQVLQVPEAPKGFCLRPQYVKNIQLLGELGLTFDICIRPEELSDGIKLAQLCPNTRFILDHCGNASARNPHQEQWERDIADFGQQPNVVCKISGIIKTVKPGWNAGKELEPIILHVIESFGTERVMFGGDWPVCNVSSSFRGWVESLDWILRNMKPEEQRKIYHDNAVRFYGLK